MTGHVPPEREQAGELPLLVPDGVAPPAGVPADVFAAAVDCFASGQRLDMQALSRKLGVGRATLYRRAGNREHLLDEVMWWRTRHLLVELMQRTAQLSGIPRLVEVIGAIFGVVRRDPALRAFLEVDRETALRIVTGTRSTLQRGLADTLGRLIDLERARGCYATELDTPTLVYAVMRIAESFLYSDRPADGEPDVEHGRTVVEALLRGLDTSREAGAPHRTAAG